MRTRLPMCAEMLAGDGLDIYAKYKLYLINAEESGPWPASRLILPNAEAYATTAEDPNGAYSDGSLAAPAGYYLKSAGYNAPPNLSPYSKPTPPAGQESVPRTHARRLRTVADNDLVVGDNLMISMARITNTAGFAVHTFNPTTPYAVGHYVRHLNSANASPYIHRCVAPSTSTTAGENAWTTDITRQPNGATFKADRNTNSNFGSPYMSYNYKVSGFEDIPRSFFIEAPFHVETAGSVEAGYIFDLDARYMSDIGPETCIFSVTENAFSAGILNSDSVPTLYPSYYTASSQRKSLTLYRSAADGFIQFPTSIDLEDTSKGHFMVLVQTAEHYTHDDLPYTQQPLIAVWSVHKNEGYVTNGGGEFILEEELTGVYNTGVAQLLVGLS